MTNGISSPRPASRVVSELVDLAAKGAGVYPTLMQAGLTFWAKWLDVTLGHYSTQTRRWALAVREPDKSPEHVQKMLDEFKTYLASAAQFPGQAVLSFNQRFEELLREPRPDPVAESPSGPVLSDEFKKNFARLQASPPVQDLARKTKADVPGLEALEQALADLRQVENRVLDARQAAHVVLERALQFARKLSVQLEETEESPSDLMRRMMADLTVSGRHSDRRAHRKASKGPPLRAVARRDRRPCPARPRVSLQYRRPAARRRVGHVPRRDGRGRSDSEPRAGACRARPPARRPPARARSPARAPSARIASTRSRARVAPSPRDRPRCRSSLSELERSFGEVPCGRGTAGQRVGFGRVCHPQGLVAGMAALRGGERLIEELEALRHVAARRVGEPERAAQRRHRIQESSASRDLEATGQCRDGRRERRPPQVQRPEPK